MAKGSRSCWTHVLGTEDVVDGSPGQLLLLKNRADTNTISGNVVSQHGFVHLLHLLQKHYSGHLDRRPPNENGEQKSAFFIISKYLQLRDMNEKHLSCDLSGPIAGEGQESRPKKPKKKQNQNPTIKTNTKGTILFLFCPRLLFIEKGGKKKSAIYTNLLTDGLLLFDLHFICMNKKYRECCDLTVT